MYDYRDLFDDFGFYCEADEFCRITKGNIINQNMVMLNEEIKNSLFLKDMENDVNNIFKK